MRGGRGTWKALGFMAVGMALGGILLSPAFAHNTPKHTKKQIKRLRKQIKNRYTKAESDARYYTKDEVSALLGTSGRVVLVPATGSAAQNGDALVAALAAIADASAINPYLLRLEPGVYELGSKMLTMKPFVDVEGSGREVTTITRAGFTSGVLDRGTVVGADDAALRDLAVENTGGTGHATAIYLDEADATLEDLRVRASGATQNTGIFVNDSSPALLGLDVRATGGTTATALRTRDSDFAVRDSLLVATLGADSAGVEDEGTAAHTVEVHGSTVEGDTDSVDAGSATVLVGASRFIGPTSGDVTCAQSYDVAFAELDAACMPPP